MLKPLLLLIMIYVTEVKSSGLDLHSDDLWVGHTEKTSQQKKEIGICA